jgi:predicted Zn-dependent peptidase
MSRVTVFALAAFAATTLALPARAAVPDYRPPAPIVRTLPNGLTVAVFPDRRLPIVQAAVLVPAGSVQETPREVGAAALTASLLTQGTATRSAEEFEAERRLHGITIGGTATREFATVSAGFRVEDLESALQMLAECVQDPLFPEDEVDAARLRLQQQQPVARQNPGALAEEHLFAMAFAEQAAGHPALGTLESLANLHRAEIQEFHRRCYRPQGALLGIAGDVDTMRVFALARELFGRWSGAAPDVPAARFVRGDTPRLRLVDVPVRNAEIRIALPAPGRETSASPAASLLAALLDDSPGGRGIAGHGERADLVQARGASVLVISASAPPESAAARIGAVRAALARVTDHPPTAAALATARTRLVGASLLQFESLAGVVGQWMAGRLAGLDDDTPARYAARLAAVTPEAIQTLAHATLAAPDPVIVVAAPARTSKAALGSLGKVEVVEVSVSPVAVELPASLVSTPPTEEELAAGRKLVAQAVAAHGGMARLRDVVDSVVESEVTLSMGEGQEVAGSLKETRKDPERYLAVMVVRTMFGQQALVGDHGWVMASALGDTVLPADSTTLANLRVSYRSDIVHLLRNASDPSARVAARGRERVGPGDANVVEVVDARGDRQVLFLDVATHRVVGIEQREGSFTGDIVVRRLFGDFRPEAGVLWPHAETRTMQGRRLMALQVKTVRVNGGIPDDAFASPGHRLFEAPPRIRR